VTALPPVRRRLLGAALRRYRESLGYSLDDAARILECDRSKISRIETGQRGIRAKELRELLTEYGVAKEEQSALVAVAHQGREQGWWQEYRDVLTDAGTDFVIMEAAATEICGYEPDRVPDLLQSMPYARAVAAADSAFTSDVQREHAVEVTAVRQRIVLTERRPRLDVVIGESALHQEVGGDGVMRAQITRLATLADNGPDFGLTLRVLPYSAGAYMAAGYGGMSILRFAQTPSLSVVHLGALHGGVSLDGQNDVAGYLRSFAQFRTAALTPAGSARLLRDLARDPARS
jgi:transcriptional regulator with XRE-family HTH domain